MDVSHSLSAPLKTDPTTLNDSPQSELSRGAFNRSHGGFELALAPALFALLGLWIDRQVGITPVLTIAFAVFAFVGVTVKQFYVYRYHMAQFEAERHEQAAA